MGRRKRRAHQRKLEGTNPEPPSSSSQNGGGDNNKEDRDLPEEPLLKILTTFPIKTLCRFRCVSNRWNHIISDPLFVRLYLSQTLSSSSSSSYTLPWTLLYRDSHKFCNQSIPDDMLRFDHLYSDQNYNHQRAIISVLDFPSSVREKHQAFPNKYTILASSNGLLLCCVNFPTIYYVCNPLTRHWVALPYHTQFFRYVREGLVTKVEGGIITSYKVVRLCYDDESTFYCFREAEIFSSETDEWKTLKVKFPKIDMRVRPFSFNGILVYYNSNHIVAYDPYNNSGQYRLIRFPNWGQPMCGVCQEHLKYMARNYFGFEVWVLEDYDNGKWKLEYKFDDFHFGYDALAFHPVDSAIVYFVSQTKIFSYNMLSKRLVPLLNVVSCRDLSAFMVLPFVLPQWPTPVPKPVIGLSQI